MLIFFLQILFSQLHCKYIKASRVSYLEVVFAPFLTERSPATSLAYVQFRLYTGTDPGSHKMNEFPKLSEQKFSFDHISVVDPDSRGQN
jgi:hypothetical protein